MFNIQSGRCLSGDHIRMLVRGLRELGVYENEEGYFDLSISHEDYNSIQADPNVINVYQYAPVKAGDRVKAMVPQFYGVRLFPRERVEQ